MLEVCPSCLLLLLMLFFCCKWRNRETRFQESNQVRQINSYFCWWVWCQMLQNVLGDVVCFCLHAPTENGWSMVSLCMQMKCSCVSDFECWTITCGWETWPNGLG
jgi:hypothetical protein